MAEVYPRPKMNFRQWVANFWYHYKWLFLFGVVAFTFIAISLFQSVFHKEPDISFLFVGAARVSDSACRSIAASAESCLSEDYNGDGKKTADIRTILLSDDYDLLNEREKIEANKALQRYTQEILAGDGAFLLLSPYFYEELDRGGALMSLYEIYGKWPDTNGLYNGLLLKDTALWNLPGFSELPDDTIICLKYAGGILGDLDDFERYEQNDRNAKIFADLCP